MRGSISTTAMPAVAQTISMIASEWMACTAASAPAMPADEESYVDMLSKMTLKTEHYRAARKNVCIIHIP